MITKDKLALNLRHLKGKIPAKPSVYTPLHPKSIKEALTYYCNQRTVHSVQSCTKIFNEENWPLPLWFNPEKIKVGFWNKIYYKKQFNSWDKKTKFKGLKGFDFFSVLLLNHIFFKISLDDILIEAFGVNSKYAFQKLLINPLISCKKPIIESIIRTYRKGDWVACVSTMFPLIDFVARRLLKTQNLGTDVSKICKLFEQNGFSLATSDYLMPHITFVSSYKLGEPFLSDDRKDWFNKMNENDFGLIGPALSSFIRFANIYYSYYKEDKEENALLNRHAILHGSINSFGTKANALKLFTFLYLFLELEAVFEILLSD